MPGETHPHKIAHVVRRFVFDEWGGTENVVWNTVLQQRKVGLEAEILATSALTTAGEEEREGIRIRRFPYWYPYFPLTQKTRLVLDKKGGNPFSPQLFRALEFGHFDLIHIHCGGRMAVLCALLAHRLKIPCVISLHGGFADVPAEELRQMMAPTKGLFHYGGIIDRLFRLRRNPVAEADGVICISHGEEKLLKERFPNKRIAYLPNGVDCGIFRVKPSCSPRAEWGIPNERRLILCISRIDYQKNQKVLLSLLSEDANSHLLLIGPITAPVYCEELKKLAQEKNVAGRLTIIPGLEHDDPRLKAILHEAQLFVLPSIHEPFGIVVLEAWAAGLAVIASNAGGLKDFVRHKRNGLLFSPDDVAELVENYKLLMENPELRSRLVATALEDVQEYSWERLSERLIALYQELRSSFPSA
ncbi:MAG: glycosyltransferase family 4 protein [Victivallales bacterium]|nr:glycosyltransferase family 4 protein [Victivallales bacterium]